MARPALPRGFTLIEVLVTIAIMAVMAGMAWRGIDGMVRTKEISEQRLDTVLRLNTVLAQWDADLAGLHDTQVVPALQFDGASMRLTRSTPEGVQVVAWTLRDGGWHRWTAPVALRRGELQEQWRRSQQLLGNEIGTLQALPGLTQWQVYFWRNNSWTNPQSTGDQASEGAPAEGGAPRQQLPQGVRLVLAMAPGSGLNGNITRDTVLRLRTE